MSEGHPNARLYRIGVLWSEARIVRQRHNAKSILDAVVLQSAISTIMGGKKGQANFNKLLKRIEHSD